MIRRTSKPTVPPAIKKLKPLALAPLATGGWLVAGGAELYCLGEDGEISGSWQWTALESAAWDGDSRTLTIRFVDGHEPGEFVTDDDDVFELVQAVRDRVNASLVHVALLPLASGGEARVLIRRAGDSSLFSQLIARGPVLATEEPALLALEAQAREAVGLT